MEGPVWVAERVVSPHSDQLVFPCGMNRSTWHCTHPDALPVGMAMLRLVTGKPCSGQYVVLQATLSRETAVKAVVELWWNDDQQQREARFEET